jgi:thymidylate synthase
MNTVPTLIEESNISTAWYLAFKQIYDNPGKDITPLLLSLNGFEESEGVRRILDLDLKERHSNSVVTVSETIFPDSLYRYCKHDRSELYSVYLKNLNRVKKIDSRNSSGTYFERLISFEDKNQLEIIINTLNSSRVRRSKLQASIFDPRKDHIESAYQGFPCLQHVTFYKADNNGLVLNSFYAIQYIYKKAYGNWLGLINLGKFVAQETGLHLERVNCFVGAEHLDEELTKTQAKKLLDMIEPEL